MPRRPSVPLELKQGPFTAAEATARGVTPKKLRGASYCRVGVGLYRWVGLKEGPELRLAAIARRLPPGAAFSGRTAARLHGLDMGADDPIEVTIPQPTTVTRRSGAVVHRASLKRSEVVVRLGLAATSALRTVVDLASRDPLTEGVVVADQFLHAKLVTMTQLHDYVATHRGASGIARQRRVFDLAEPGAESPMETRLRMVLILAGLSRPEVQISIYDHRKRFLGRPDLLYREQRLAIEYDGGNHRDRLVDDNRRQNLLIGFGLRLLRFTAADVYGNPELVVMQVRQALSIRLT